jgi:hypothetical protein
MSSQGNDLVRGLLWMACQAAIRCNPALRPLYARQRAAGTRGDVALGHCMRKLLHLVFALWKTNQPFDPAHYQWEAPPPQSEDAATTNPLDRAVDTPPRSATEGAATAPTDLATRNRSHAGQAGNAATLAAAEHCVVTIATSDPVVTPRPARRPAPTPSAAPAPPTKKAAGRTEAMPPRQAVTAAANELATRKIPPPREPSNRAPLTDGAARRPAPGVWVDLGHVRAQITMEQVLSNLGVLPRLRGHGPQRRGPCPIHGSEGRPFSVHLGKNVFRCLHVPCGTQGNVLDLWAAVRNLPLRDAAMDLAHTFQLQLAPNKRANR